MSTLHQPVLVNEVMTYLAPRPHKKYLDCTLGTGGHSLALLKQGATVVAIDRDPEALSAAKARLTKEGLASRLSVKQGSFASVLADESLGSGYDGALFDLGVSSMQLDTPERGFSFRFDTPLDMRMDPSTQSVTAKDLINGLGKKELYELFRELGEEPSARRLGETICRARKLSPIETTLELAELVEAVVPRTGHLHPATKVFQALRMAVNSEREELKAALPSALSRLRASGLLAVISFHSGEDRIVKKQFANWSRQSKAASLTPKPVTPQESELETNQRARSAKLRVVRKLS